MLNVLVYLFAVYKRCGNTHITYTLKTINLFETYVLKLYVLVYIFETCQIYKTTFVGCKLKTTTFIDN